jgi:hypothetical protein
MTTDPQDEDTDATRTDPAQTSLDDNGDAGRQVAHVTGMTPEAAETFAAYHSGRYSQGSAFRRAA